MFQTLVHRQDVKITLKVVISLVVLVSLLLCPISAFASDDSSDRVEPTEEVNITTLRISASDTSGFHAVMLTLIGDYNPIVKDYTYTTTSYNGTQTTNHSIDIQPDWSWICTCAVFIVIIFCLFRLVGGLFSCKR